VNRREFLATLAAIGTVPACDVETLRAADTPGFQFVDVTSAAGIAFRHNSGAYGGKLLPETLGSGCAFIDYDADGWQDILFVNGTDWPGHARQRSTPPRFQDCSTRT